VSVSLEILDNSSDPIATPREGFDRLVIGASAAGTFDADAFMARLAAMRGRERIKSASVTWSSNLVDCGFLRYFENIIGVTLGGKHLASLAGVRNVPRLANLSVPNSKTNRIDLSELAGSSVDNLRIERPRPVDLETIGRCAHIRDLDLVHVQTLDLQILANMQLKELALVYVKNEEIASLDVIERIEKLNLAYCRSLRRITGPSTKVTTLWIETCNGLEFESLAAAASIKRLRVATCKQPFDIAVLASLPELEHVSFALCKLALDKIERIRAPKLRRFWANPMKDDVVSRISRAFPAAMVCNGRVLEIDGVRQPRIQRFYED
jgi:hypothetical protein